MDEKNFADLLKSAGEALEHAKGKLELKTTVLPEPPEPMTAAEIRSLRQKLNASQAVFAHYLNVSPKLVQAWEARRRSPQGPALLLLRIAARDSRSLVAAFQHSIAEEGRPKVAEYRARAKARGRQGAVAITSAAESPRHDPGPAAGLPAGRPGGPYSAFRYAASRRASVKAFISTAILSLGT
jgi:putative transcriptional regulator